MHGTTSAICWLILGIVLVLVFAQTAEEAQKKLQGTWTATKAERDGKVADGKPLNAGTFRDNGR
jgi:hypothetical protein